MVNASPHRPWTIGVYGGSFDPPHVGHVMACAYVLSVCDVDEVLVVPTFAHALKGAAGASYEDRVRMARGAFHPFSRVSVSRVEADLGEPSRTARTLEALAHPDIRLKWIMGTDLLHELPKWYRLDDIMALATPIVVGREASDRSHPPQVQAWLEAGEVLPLDIPNVSSSEVRARVAGGEDVTGLLPRSVQAQIRSMDLYKGSPGS